MASVGGMSEVSAKSFLGLLQKSGICDTAELKATLSALSRNADGKPIRLDQLTGHLLKAGLISEWHIKKLLAGKYKGFFLGKYKLLRHLGTGGMSTVYVAQHTIFNQKRAIKVLPRDRIADKTFLERFYREGRAAASLNHKNIVRVYDIDHEGDTHYLVMEYAKGQDIYELVKKSGPLDFDKAIDYTVQALTGLQHAHDNELVHRDVKPANLLVTPDGDIKILDLGLALFQEDDSSLTVMHNERVLGTADYLSPEQAVDSHNLDHRADIYSTGCTLYYMLTGKPPFHEGTLAQRIARHQTCEPKNIRDLRSDCPDELVSIVAKMMKKNPDERYQSCDALAAVLRRAGEALLHSPAISAGSAQRLPVAEGTLAAPAGKVAIQNAKNRPPQKQRPATSPKKPNATSAKPTADSRPEQQARSSQTTTANAAVTKSDRTKSDRQPAAQRQPAKAAKNIPVDGGAKPASKRAKSEIPKPAAAASQGPGRNLADKNKRADGGSDPRKQSQKPVHQKKSVETGTPASSKPAARPATGEPGPIAKSSVVSVVVPNAPASQSMVGKQELNRFVTDNSTSVRQSVRPVRKPVKNQLLVTGMVIGMLALLGIALAIAINLVSPDDEKQGKSGDQFLFDETGFDPSLTTGGIDTNLVESSDDSRSLFIG